MVVVVVVVVVVSCYIYSIVLYVSNCLYYCSITITCTWIPKMIIHVVHIHLFIISPNYCAPEVVRLILYYYYNYNFVYPSVPSCIYGRQTLSRQIRTLPDRIYKRVHSPFGCHHAGAIPGPAISINYISQIGAHLEPHDQQRNQQQSREISRDRNFSQLTLLSN